MSIFHSSSSRIVLFLLLALWLGLDASHVSVCVAGSSSPVNIVYFDFEDGAGGPDTQGWRPLNSFGSEYAYSHVEDFTGAGQLAAPLAGSQSFWFGLPAEDPRTCHWNAPPGYGSYWNEDFISTEFTVQGDVHLDYLYDMFVEMGYENVWVEYEDPTGEWIELARYSCGAICVGECYPQDCGMPSDSHTIPAAFHDGTIRFRFHFASDNVGDQESSLYNVFQKAFTIDNLTVTDDTGIVDFQDFEGEAVGDAITADGDWFTRPNTDDFNGGFLVDGDDVLQDSPQINDTYVWAFFENSPEDFSCAGHPEQLAVPVSHIHVRSPLISLVQDEFGNEIAGDIDSLEVSFDVYRDFPEPNFLQEYTWQVRSYSDTCQLDSSEARGSDEGEQQDWFRQVLVFTPAAGATRIEIELGVDNPSSSPSACHSHAPLFDNVTVRRFGGDVVTASEPVTPTRLVLRSWPNPFNPTTTIAYEVPAGVGRVALRIYDASGRLVRTLVDDERSEGPARVTWNGTTNTGDLAASGVYFGRLSAGTQSTSHRMVLLK